MTLALYILALIVTGLLSYRLARTVEAHKWAQKCRDMKDEARKLRYVAWATDDYVNLPPTATELEHAKAYTEMLTALDDLWPGRVKADGKAVA